jgi:hypothetical protein
MIVDDEVERDAKRPADLSGARLGKVPFVVEKGALDDAAAPERIFSTCRAEALASS